MAMRNWIVCAALAALVGLGAPGAVSLAKPPDLPVNLDVECPDAQESPSQGSYTLDLDVLGGKIVLQIQTKSTPGPETVPCLDSLAPIIMEALCRQILAQVQEAKNPADYDQVRISQARAMFLIGERCHKKGDLDKARTCYQEAHLQCPLSKYGRRAIARLAEIDAATTGKDNGAAEEQEPPLLDPQSREKKEEKRRQEMLRSTVPLGLVPFDLWR